MHWHHAYETDMKESEQPKKRFKRWISWYRKTNNPLVIQAYIEELTYCILLCKKHHEKVHADYRKEKAKLAAAQLQAKVSALQQEYKGVVRNHHTMKKLIRERRKLWWVCVCVVCVGVHVCGEVGGKEEKCVCRLAVWRRELLLVKGGRDRCVCVCV